MTLRRVFSGFSEEWSEVWQSCAHSCVDLLPCFTFCPSLLPMELPSLIKDKCPGLHLSGCFPEITLIPQIPLPIPSAAKFILFSVISVKSVRGTIPVHRSILLPHPSLSLKDFNFCKDLQAQDFFRKPFNRIFQFRSH